ncbi:MAG TPA: hypothetical protein VNW28_05660 [Chthoniobacterales bacterium]|jgi:succinyl-CoA synthetase alpha subunit|nr:hypothetical protein [Chthoniobacterales bacterium]
MAILIDETKRVLVQGITGREGPARTRLMREYGTKVVAAVTPEQTREKPMGRIDPVKHGYDGPAAQSVAK